MLFNAGLDGRVEMVDHLITARCNVDLTGPVRPLGEVVGSELQELLHWLRADLAMQSVECLIPVNLLPRVLHRDDCAAFVAPGVIMVLSLVVWKVDVV